MIRSRRVRLSLPLERPGKLRVSLWKFSNKTFARLRTSTLPLPLAFKAIRNDKVWRPLARKQIQCNKVMFVHGPHKFLARSDANTTTATVAVCINKWLSSRRDRNLAASFSGLAKSNLLTNEILEIINSMTTTRSESRRRRGKNWNQV